MIRVRILSREGILYPERSLTKDEMGKNETKETITAMFDQ